jgi:hypothetical protein
LNTIKLVDLAVSDLRRTETPILKMAAAGGNPTNQ